MPLKFVHVVACVKISFLFNGNTEYWLIFHWMYIQHFVYPFIHQWTLGLLPPFLQLWTILVMNMGVNISLISYFHFGGYIPNSVEKAMAPHSSTLAWKIPWMEEPGGLQSMGSLRVGDDWATSLWLFTFLHWRRKWQPTPVFLPENPRDGEPDGLSSMGSHRVGHDWSDLVVAVANDRCI